MNTMNKVAEEPGHAEAKERLQQAIDEAAVALTRDPKGKGWGGGGAPLETST